MENKSICSICGKGAFYLQLQNEHKYLCSSHKTQYIKNIKTLYTPKKISKNNCNTHSTFDLGKSLFQKLDEISELLNVNEVLIENQPSMKNPKMKTIATFLYSYFIIRGVVDGNSINAVHFISPSKTLSIVPLSFANDPRRATFIPLSSYQVWTLSSIKDDRELRCIIIDGTFHC